MDNFNENKILSEAERAATDSGINPQMLKNALKTKNLNNVLKSLNSEQAKMLTDTLKDKAAIENLLKSPEALKLMKKLSE